MGEVDTEKLILAVKKYPALYKKDVLNTTKKDKIKMWIQVCKEVYAGWEHFEKQNKDGAVYELRRRWKSVRTCFRREIINQERDKLTKNTECLSKKRKRYEYYNLLSFLHDKDGDDETETGEHDTTDPLNDDFKNEPYETESPCQVTFMHEEIPIEHETPASGTFRSVYEKPNIENKVLDILKEIKKDEEDEDRQFMLSLVPSFRKLSDKQKFEAKIEILRVLKNVSFKEDN